MTRPPESFAVVGLLLAMLTVGSAGPPLWAQVEGDPLAQEDLLLPYELENGMLPPVEARRRVRLDAGPVRTKAGVPTWKRLLRRARTKFAYAPWARLAGVGALFALCWAMVWVVRTARKEVKPKPVHLRRRRRRTAESLHSLEAAIASMHEMSRTPTSDEAVEERRPASTHSA